MKARLEHIQINVSKKDNVKFYKDLLTYLGFKVILEEETFVGMGDGENSIWIQETEDKFKKNKFHRKNTGINHIALKVTKKSDVDEFFEQYLKPRKIKTLYGTPKLFPEYGEDYYAVYFEDPDRLKIEIMYFSG